MTRLPPRVSQLQQHCLEFTSTEPPYLGKDVRRSKELGAFTALQFIEGVEGLTAAAFSEILGWSEEEITVFNAKVRADCKRRDVHCMHEIGNAYKAS
ncbi:hypothetical protein VTN77DRAFT_4311 [Rasamsonia byssochlamydoides]|uniref:uncharacterized protein n=1 Tax=Rasamsonia byssochlamydoides TaxID=89139 RepID=UPI00374294C9